MDRAASGSTLGDHDHIAHGIRDGRGLEPVAGVAVSLPRRTVGSGQRGDLESGVIGQQLDKTLPYSARHAQDTYGDPVGNLFHHHPPGLICGIRMPQADG